MNETGTGSFTTYHAEFNNMGQFSTQSNMKPQHDSTFKMMSLGEKNQMNDPKNMLWMKFKKMQEEINRFSEIQNLHLMQVSQNVDLLENLRTKLVLEGFLQKYQSENHDNLAKPPTQQDDRNFFKKNLNNISNSEFESTDNIIKLYQFQQLKNLKNNLESINEGKITNEFWNENLELQYKNFVNDKNSSFPNQNKFLFNSNLVEEKKETLSFFDGSQSNDNYLNNKINRQEFKIKNSIKITGCPHTNRKHYAKVIFI